MINKDNKTAKEIKERIESKDCYVLHINHTRCRNCPALDYMLAFCDIKYQKISKVLSCYRWGLYD